MAMIALVTLKATTATELEETLSHLKFAATVADDSRQAFEAWPEILLEDRDGRPITQITLVECTLSDGSKTYHARLF